MNGSCEYVLTGKELCDAEDADDREQILVEGARKDKDSFCELYMAYYPKIFSYVAKRVGRAADCEDITMSTFEKALACLDQYDPKKGSFSAWLYRIALNTTTDHLRRNRRSNTVSFEGLGNALVFASEDKAGAERDFDEVMRLIRKLGEQNQVILVLRFMDGMSNDQLAEVLGCSNKAVSMRVSRALRAFRKAAKEEGYYQGGCDA